MNPPRADQIVKQTFQLSESVENISDWLASNTGLAKGRIKLAMANGAVQCKKPQAKWQRLRRATARLPKGSTIQLFYNPVLLATKPSSPELSEDCGRYSVWFKPPGIMSQGNEWGDHCSILRLAELHFKNARQVFPVHRLDQDASGLMLIAHDKKSAALLSGLFAERKIEKSYRVRVEGTWDSNQQRIEVPLDGRRAVTNVKCLECVADTSLLLVEIETGRKHQIRRHLSHLGHPVLGDALYGVKNSQPLHLAATKLSYPCPVQGRSVTFELSIDHIKAYWQ